MLLVKMMMSRLQLSAGLSDKSSMPAVSERIIAALGGLNTDKDIMKKHVLIVDDFGSVRRMLRAALRPLVNVEIHEADHGLSAWDRLQAARHDLLISDVCMPHLDGWELVQRVRQSEHHPALPIILVSAEPAPAMLPPGMRFFGKPFKPQLLRRAVAEFLDLRSE